MKRFYQPLLLIFATLLALSACESSNSDTSVSISGIVINQSTGKPLYQAVVEIISPVELNATSVTDSSGAFSFKGIEIDATTDIVIEAKKTGFDRVSITVVASKGLEVSLDNPLVLIPEDEDPDDEDGGGDDGVQGPSTGPAAIILTSIPKQAINIAETGDEISSAFTFQVQDSAGRALSNSNSVIVNFEIISGPGGGEAVTPASIETNADGKVTTSLFSGNRAGPVKIQASITRPELGLTIKSTPVLIAIHGGFPDQDHFSLTLAKRNIEGYNFNNVRDEVTVIVGDEFSNPVKPGTVVYFNTTGGTIQGSKETDADGLATVELITAKPRPNENIVGSGGRPGYGYVIASTIGKSNQPVIDSTVVLFSGLPQTPTVTPTTFNIAPNGGVSFNYEVTDQFGNPLAAGTKFKVEVGEGLAASGDVDFTLGDYLFPGVGSTQFSFSVSDIDDENDDPGETTIKISVTTPKNQTSSITLSGTRAKTK